MSDLLNVRASLASALCAGELVADVRLKGLGPIVGHDVDYRIEILTADGVPIAEAFNMTFTYSGTVRVDDAGEARIAHTSWSINAPINVGNPVINADTFDAAMEDVALSTVEWMLDGRYGVDSPREPDWNHRLPLDGWEATIAALRSRARA